MAFTDWQNLLALLTQDEQAAVTGVLQKLKNRANNVEQLDPEDKVLLANLARKYADELQAEAVEPEPEETTPADTAHHGSGNMHKTLVSSAFMQTAFAAFMREQLELFWCSSGASLTDAIRHAFANKWLPDELKLDLPCERIYGQYQRDIDAANAFRLAVQNDAIIAKDKRMAVGLAWFSYLYRMQQLLEQDVDLNLL